MNIAFTVDKDAITRTDEEAPAARSIGRLTASFIFSEDWDGYTKSALWWTAGMRIPAEVLLDADSTCTVPESTILPGRLYVTVKGVDAAGSRHTCGYMFLIITDNGYTGGTTPTPKEQTTLEQLEAAVTTLSTTVDDLGDTVSATDDTVDAMSTRVDSIDAAVTDLDAAMETVEETLPGKESTANKTTALTAESTDVQYPSAKAAYDAAQVTSQKVTDALGYTPVAPETEVLLATVTVTGSPSLITISQDDNGNALACKTIKLKGGFAGAEAAQQVSVRAYFGTSNSPLYSYVDNALRTSQSNFTYEVTRRGDRSSWLLSSSSSALSGYQQLYRQQNELQTSDPITSVNLTAATAFPDGTIELWGVLA